MGCLWRSLAASIPANPFSCYPRHAAHCFFLILPRIVWVFASLGKARWMKHCQWHSSMNAGESWLPSEMIAGALQAVPGHAGAYSCESRLSPELCQEPAQQAGLAACPSMPEACFSLTGSLNLLVRVRNKRAIDTQVWSLSGNRGNVWQQAHVPINPPGPFQVSQGHSQGATCHLHCPCAMDVHFLADIFLCSTGASGAQGGVLAALNPQGHWGKAKDSWMHKSQIHFSLRFLCASICLALYIF